MTKVATDVESLMVTTLGENGQIIVPKQFRDALGLESGAPLAAVRVGRGLLLLPQQEQFRVLCDRIAAAFADHGITPEEVIESLPAARQSVFERLYPNVAADEE